ncbi:MAG: glycosyltransferase [Oscillatoriaceae cyanobacterium Prado104]|jgi:hypothetical protein|nr:glycosyltransferase [Oscillatoriaceae cyanobacterium Prado104]
MKALILLQGQNVDPVTEWMIEPFKSKKFELQFQLNLKIDIQLVESFKSVLNFLETQRYDIVFIATSWKENVKDTLELFATIHKLHVRPKIVYLDSFDQTSSPFFGIIPYVDLYLKKQILRDRSLYVQGFKTGYIFADFVADYYKANFQDWHFGSLIDESCIEKIALGWNLATANKLVKVVRFDLMRRLTKFSSRTIDIHYRVSLANPDDKGVYYNIHREAIYSNLKPLCETYQVICAAGKSARVPLKQYRAEMKNAKLAVSPFGWGEVTDRDYEIVLNETLLIKPDMSHLETEPNIYVEGKTYVPVKWDLSDLTKICDYYLKHPQEAETIAKQAKAEYFRWFQEKQFVNKIKQILDQMF